METAGLMGIEKYSLTLGITYLYIGINPGGEPRIERP
jgi:hypothetical protein